MLSSSFVCRYATQPLRLGERSREDTVPRLELHAPARHLSSCNGGLRRCDKAPILASIQLLTSAPCNPDCPPKNARRRSWRRHCCWRARSAAALITTSDIATAVGVTQGAVFKHFPTKDAIWLAAMGWVRGAVVVSRSKPRPARPSSPIEALGAMFKAHIGFVVTHPGVPRLIFHELQRPADSPIKQEVRNLLQVLPQAAAQSAGRGGGIAARSPPRSISKRRRLCSSEWSRAWSCNPWRPATPPRSRRRPMRYSPSTAAASVRCL